MAETTMPAAEANVTVEHNSYELAFHVLPTVAEGEVAEIADAIKAEITTHEGVIGEGETPARIELAYSIEKYLEGKYRKFNSAYFGWVRFTAPASSIEEINEFLSSHQSVLRHMVLKLTKLEEVNPFHYHAAMAEEAAPVANVDVEAALQATDSVEAEEVKKDAATEEPAAETEEKS